MNVSRVVPRDAIPSVDGPSLGERHDGAAADTVIAVEGGERPLPTRYGTSTTTISSTTPSMTTRAPR
jgi:hypothetical protein